MRVRCVNCILMRYDAVQQTFSVPVAFSFYESVSDNLFSAVYAHGLCPECENQNGPREQPVLLHHRYEAGQGFQCRVEENIAAGALCRGTRSRYRAGLYRRLLERYHQRHLLLCSLRQRAVQIRRQVCQRVRMAEFLRTHTEEQRDLSPGFLVRHGPHRGSLRTMRVAPGTYIRRWPRPYLQTLLHELDLTGFRAAVEITVSSRLPVPIPEDV